MDLPCTPAVDGAFASDVAERVGLINRDEINDSESNSAIVAASNHEQ
jgi:hypothetical protein